MPASPSSYLRDLSEEELHSHIVHRKAGVLVYAFNAMKSPRKAVETYVGHDPMMRQAMLDELFSHVLELPSAVNENDCFHGNAQKAIKMLEDMGAVAPAVKLPAGASPRLH